MNVTSKLASKARIPIPIFSNQVLPIWYCENPIKMAITGIGLFILVMHSNFVVYGFITVRHIIYALVPLYLLLIAHEINMLATI